MRTTDATPLSVPCDQEHPELINLYISGTTLYALALEMTSCCSTRRRRLPEAQSDLELALKLLRYHTRALPTQHAAARLALARVLRTRANEESLACAALLHIHSDGRPVSTKEGGATAAAAAAEVEMINQARELLLQCLTLSALDGANQQALIREALLELAATFLPADASSRLSTRPDGGDGGGSVAAAAVASALRLAYSSATKAILVQRSSHLLTPVAVPQLPEWAVAFAKGQEQCFRGQHVSTWVFSLGLLLPFSTGVHPNLTHSLLFMSPGA